MNNISNLPEAESLITFSANAIGAIQATMARCDELLRWVERHEETIKALRGGQSMSDESQNAIRVELKELSVELRSLTKSFEDKINALQERVVSIESQRNWLIGIVMGSVVLAILSLVVGPRVTIKELPPDPVQQQAP